MTTGRILLFFCRAVRGVSLFGALKARAEARALGTAPFWFFVGMAVLYLLGSAGEYVCMKRYFPERYQEYRSSYVASDVLGFLVIALGYLTLFKF